MPDNDLDLYVNSFKQSPNTKAAAVRRGAEMLGVDAEDYATALAYETAGSFDPWQKGPVTKWGRHRGTMQYGEPQAKEFGVHEKQSFEDQVTNSNVRYLKQRGVKPGADLLTIYKAINGGNVTVSENAKDINGTIRSHVEKMNRDWRAKARKFLGVVNNAEPESDIDGYVNSFKSSNTNLQSDSVDDYVNSFKQDGDDNQPLGLIGMDPMTGQVGNQTNAVTQTIKPPVEDALPTPLPSAGLPIEQIHQQLKTPILQANGMPVGQSPVQVFGKQTVKPMRRRTNAPSGNFTTGAPTSEQLAAAQAEFEQNNPVQAEQPQTETVPAEDRFVSVEEGANKSLATRTLVDLKNVDLKRPDLKEYLAGQMMQQVAKQHNFTPAETETLFNELRTGGFFDDAKFQAEINAATRVDKDFMFRGKVPAEQINQVLASRKQTEKLLEDEPYRQKLRQEFEREIREKNALAQAQQAATQGGAQISAGRVLSEEEIQTEIKKQLNSALANGSAKEEFERRDRVANMGYGQYALEQNQYFANAVGKGFTNVVQGLGAFQKAMLDLSIEKPFADPNEQARITRLRDRIKNDETGFQKFGQSISNWVDEKLPVNRDLKNQFITKLSSGAGSAASFMLLGGISNAAGISHGAVSGSFGALGEVGSQYDDLKKKGLNASDAARWSQLGLPIGVSEAFGIGRQLDKLTAGMFSRGFGKFLAETGKEASEEALQEFFQTAAGSSVKAVATSKDKTVGGRLNSFLTNLPNAAKAGADAALVAAILGGGTSVLANGAGEIENRFDQAGNPNESFSQDSTQIDPDMSRKAENLPNPATPAPVPESSQTLAAQQQAVGNPASPRAAILYTPGETVPQNIDRNFRIAVKEGTLDVSVEKAKHLGLETRDEIKSFIGEHGIQGLLGRVEDVGNQTSTGVAVQSTDAQTGTELNTSIVTSEESANKQAELDAAAFPDSQITSKLLPAQDAVNNRENGNTQTNDQSEAPTAQIPPQTQTADFVERRTNDNLATAPLPSLNQVGTNESPVNNNGVLSTGDVNNATPTIARENGKIVVKQGAEVKQSFPDNSKGEERANRFKGQLEIANNANLAKQNARNVELAETGNNIPENSQNSETTVLPVETVPDADKQGETHKIVKPSEQDAIDDLNEHIGSLHAASPPIEDVLPNANLTTDGKIARANAEATEIIRRALQIAFPQEDSPPFYGLFLPPNHIEKVGNALMKMRQDASTPEARQQVTKLLNIVRDDSFAEKGLPIVSVSPDLPNGAREAVEEETAHQADINLRGGISAAGILSHPTAQKAAAKIKESYGDISDETLGKEVVAKSFRDDAETELDMSEPELSELREAYAELLLQNDIDSATIANAFREVSNRGREFAQNVERRSEATRNGDTGETESDGANSVRSQVRSSREIRNDEASKRNDPADRLGISREPLNRRISAESGNGESSDGRITERLDSPIYARSIGDFLKEAAKSDPEFKEIEQSVEQLSPEEKGILGKAISLIWSGGRETSRKDIVVGIRRAGLLTGIKTHLRNLTANSAFQITEEAARPIAALADIAVEAVLKTGQRTATGLSPSVFVKSIRAAIKTDDIHRAMNDPQYGQGGLATAWKIIRNGDVGGTMEAMQLKEAQTGSPILDTYMKAVFRTLSAEDAVFKAFACRRSLHDQAKALALTARRKDKTVDVKERTQEFLENPTVSMQAQAALDASYATFQNDNKISTAFQKLKDTDANLKAGIEFIVPFDRTPTNIVLRVLENSPLGFAKSGVNLKRLWTGTSKARKAEIERMDARNDLIAKRLEGFRKRGDARFERQAAIRDGKIETVKESIKSLEDSENRSLAGEKLLTKQREKLTILSNELLSLKDEHEIRRQQRSFNDLSLAEKQSVANSLAAEMFTRQEQREFANTVGRASMGSAYLALGILLASKGLMAGIWNYDDDDKNGNKEYFKRRESGIENGSVLLPNVGRFIVSDSPGGKVMALGASLYEQSTRPKRKDETDAGKIAKSVGYVGEQAIFEQPLLKAAEDYKPSKLTKNPLNAAGSFVGSFIPTIINDAGEVLDDKARKASAEKGASLGEQFTTPIIKRIPVARISLKESKGGVDATERGGIVRRLIRAADPLNTRSAKKYKYK